MAERRGMDRLLPQNIDAEMGVLGSIIIDPTVIPPIAEFLRAEDFYRDAHRTIYEAILALDGRNEPADLITICDELERMGKMEAAGGDSYITSLINYVPTSGNAEYYGRIVESTAMLRQTISVAGKIAALAYEPGADGKETILRAEQLLMEVSNRQRSGGGFLELSELIGTYMSDMERMAAQFARGVVTGAPTGFPMLDRLTGGWQPSDLITVAGRPGQGKTALLLAFLRTLALEASENGWICLFYSMEMAWRQIVNRLLSMESGIDQSRLRIANLREQDDEWGELVRAGDRYPVGRVYIDDRPRRDVAEIRQSARRFQMEHPNERIIVFVDYMQLAHAKRSDGRLYESMVDETTEISGALKGLARELNCPLVALAQLSRAVEQRAGKVPQLSDLRNSGSIEQDSDVVMFIYREDDDRDDDEEERPGYPVNLILAKQRNGPSDIFIPAYFTRATVRFDPVDPVSTREPEPDEDDTEERVRQARESWNKYSKQ